MDADSLQLFGRNVYDHDLVGGFHKALRHGIRCAPARNALDRILLFQDMLQVDGADDVDTVVADLLHVLPPVCVTAAGRVISGELVHQADVRTSFQNGFDIDRVAVPDAQGRDDLEFGDQLFDFVRSLGLNGPDHNVLSALLAAAAFVKHAEGFADARCVAEEDLEPAARVVSFLRLDLAKECFGIGTAKFL